MKNYRAFKVETLKETNTLPTRVKITDLRFDESVIVGYYSDSANTEIERALEILKERGIEIVAQAWREVNGEHYDYTILLSENFIKSLKP